MVTVVTVVSTVKLGWKHGLGIQTSLTLSFESQLHVY